MTSYVWTIIEKRYHWEKVYEILKEKYDKDFEMIFAVRKSCQEKQDLLALKKENKNVKVLEFEDDKTENFMIEKAIKQTKGQELVLCRDYFDYDTIKSDYLLALNTHGAQIVLFKKEKKRNKIKDFFAKAYKKIVRFIFGFSLYDADVGLIYFSNIALDVLRAMPNSVLLTKVNKWAGFDVSYITIDELAKPKLEKNEKKQLVLFTALSAVLLALTILGFVLFAVFGKLSFLLGLFLLFCFIIFVFILSYFALKLSIVCRYGDLKQ